MAEKGKLIAACLGKLGGDKAGESLRRLFERKGSIKEAGYTSERSDERRSDSRGSDESIKLQVRGLKEEA